MKTQRKRKALSLLVMFFFLVCLSSCNSPSYDVSVTSTIEYENSELDVCTIVTKVEGIKIKDHHRDKQKISVGEYSVLCPMVNVRKLGKKEAIIQVNGIDTTLFFEVEDTTAPIITADKEYKVEELNPYFKIEKMISIKDSYDEHPIIGFIGDYDLHTPGVYEITVQAKDANKNKSSRNIKITVSKKEIQVIEKEISVEVQNSSTPNQNTTNNGGTSIPTNPTALPAKTFSVEEGFDLNSAFSACKSYRGSNSGACSPYNGSNGLFGGYVYEP